MLSGLFCLVLGSAFYGLICILYVMESEKKYKRMRVGVCNAGYYSTLVFTIVSLLLQDYVSLFSCGYSGRKMVITYENFV